jgi:hypothetical protein
VYTDLLLFLTLPKSQALPRAQFFAKSQIKNSRQRKTPNKEASLTRAIKKILGTDYFAERQTAGSRQRNFKKLFFTFSIFLFST